LSAVDTDCCRLRRAAVAFVVPLPLPAIVVQRCRRRSTLPSSKDAAVVVGRCRCRRTLLPHAVVSRRRRLLQSRMSLVAVFRKGVRKKGARREVHWSAVA
jgi:hypothetical protein